MKNIIFFLIFTFITTNAKAYIDPGLGSLLIQSLIGGFAVFFGLISIYFKKIKTLINKFFKSYQNTKQKK